MESIKSTVFSFSEQKKEEKQKYDQNHPVVIENANADGDCGYCLHKLSQKVMFYRKPLDNGQGLHGNAKSAKGQHPGTEEKTCWKIRNASQFHAAVRQLQATDYQNLKFDR